MTDQKLAQEFERLRAAYKEHWYTKDTDAFHNFVFANSDALSKLLAKGAK